MLRVANLDCALGEVDVVREKRDAFKFVLHGERFHSFKGVLVAVCVVEACKEVLCAYFLVDLESH